MRTRPGARWLMLLFVLLLGTCGALAAAALARSGSRAPIVLQTSSPRAQPWTNAQTVEPNALAKELAGRSPRPTVVCVGFPTLYRGGHVPGASFHGPASTAEGLADLKGWAQHVPRTGDVVLYCGCCPFAECPNVRPAFTALRDMGFTHVRVLRLPHNFDTDWVGSGFPVERESERQAAGPSADGGAASFRQQRSHSWRRRSSFSMILRTAPNAPTTDSGSPERCRSATAKR